MSALMPGNETIILEALLLHAKGYWRSLECLANKGESSSNPVSTALLRALCTSPFRNPTQSQQALTSLADLNSRSGCALAISHCLMSRAQEQLLIHDLDAAHSSLRQAVASTASAVAATGISIPSHFLDHLISMSDYLVSVLASQLDLQLISRRDLLPEQLVFVLGMHRSGTSALSGLLVHAGLDAPRDLMPASPGNPLGYWESLGAMKINDRLLQQLGCHWSKAWILPQTAWDSHPEAIRRWRSEMLELLQSSYPKGGRAIIKDPRLCVLLPAIIPWLESNLLPIATFLPIRHPVEVSESLRVAEGIPRSQGLLLWISHVLNAERFTRGFDRLIFDYQQVLLAPKVALELAADLLDQSRLNGKSVWPWKLEEATTFINPQLQRQYAGEDTPGWVLDENAESWYELSLNIHSVMIDKRLEEREREGIMDQLWSQWLTLSSLPSQEAGKA
jgi:hypothetical protein